MKHFKFWRNLSLIISVWSFISFLYIVVSKFPRWSCCAVDVVGYRLFTLVQYLMEVRYAAFIDCAPCDINNLPLTYNIVPVDLLVIGLMSFGLFVYLQSRRE